MAVFIYMFGWIVSLVVAVVAGHGAAVDGNEHLVSLAISFSLLNILCGVNFAVLLWKESDEP